MSSSSVAMTADVVVNSNMSAVAVTFAPIIDQFVANVSIFQVGCIMYSCQPDNYIVQLCVGYSVTAAVFGLLLLYTCFVIIKVILCRDLFTSPLRLQISIALSTSAVLLSLTLVIHLVLSPTAPVEFSVVAFHLLTIFIFIFSRQMDLINAEPKPNDTRPRVCILLLVGISIFIAAITILGSLENRDMEERCMSFFHLGSALLEVCLVPLLFFQTRKSLAIVHSVMACNTDRKSAAVRSITSITTLILLSAVSGLIYTGASLSLGRHLGSCAAVFNNDPTFFMAIFPLYLIMRYLLTTIALLKIYILPDIIRREEQAGLLDRVQQRTPPATSKFQYPTRFRHLDLPANDALMDPTGYLVSAPGITDDDYLENIAEVSEDHSSGAGAVINVRISAGTQMSLVSELADDSTLQSPSREDLPVNNQGNSNKRLSLVAMETRTINIQQQDPTSVELVVASSCGKKTNC